MNEAGGRPLSLLVTPEVSDRDKHERRGSGFLRRRLSSAGTVKGENRRSVFGLRLK